MAGPNYDRKLPLVICDPNREITQFVQNTLAIEQPRRYNSFEYLQIDTIEQVGNSIPPGSIPKYAAVFYSVAAVRAGCADLARVRTRDRLMPQFIVDQQRQLPETLLNDAIQRKVRGYVITEDGLIQESMKVFAVMPRLDDGAVLKSGGSGDDYQRFVSRNPNLREPGIMDYCAILIDLYTQKGKGASPPTILITFGAGQAGEVIKDWARAGIKYEHDIPERASFFRSRTYKALDDSNIGKLYPQQIFRALDLNLNKAFSFFGSHYAKVIPPDAPHIAQRMDSTNYIHLALVPPHYIMVRDEIPLQDSDTHTIAWADALGVNVILIKDTDGVYQFDPLRGFVGDPQTLGCKDYRAWKEAQNGNRLIERISAQEILDGKISREGTREDGTSDGAFDHLIEPSAAAYFANARYVQTISIVPIDPLRFYVPRYKLKDPKEKRADNVLDDLQRVHIITGEPCESLDKKELRRRCLIDALKGRARSIITRN